MSRALAAIPGVKVGRTFLQIPPGTSKAKFAQIATEAVNVSHGVHWWIADLAKFAEHYLDEKAVEELCDATGMQMYYIKLLAKTGEKYPVRRRVDGLSISHHIAVMHLMPAKRAALLKRARDRAWSSTKLRSMSAPPEKKVFTLRVHVPVKQRNKKLFQEVQALCDRYEANFSVVGEVRHFGLRKRPRLIQV